MVHGSTKIEDPWAIRPKPLVQSELESIGLMGGVALESVFGMLMHRDRVES